MNKCETCGHYLEYTDSTTCINCKEVESRINQYIRSEAGRNKLLTLLFKDHLERMANHAGRNEGD
jgi:hypothetical protein